MLRGNNIACATTTTGTGTLTLAACPTAIGAVDPDVWARSALGGTNSQVIHVRYEIIEYADGTFATPKQTESGIGALTLGASSGVANCTLSRDFPTETATGLNTQPATLSLGEPVGYSDSNPLCSPMTIGTAANCLIMLSIDVRDSVGGLPIVFNNSVTSSQGTTGIGIGEGFTTFNPGNGSYLWFPVWLINSQIIKTVIFCQNSSGLLSGATSSSAQVALYDMFGTHASGNGPGIPGRIILNFGGIGNGFDATNPLTTTAFSLTASKSAFIRSGIYWLGMTCAWSGGTGVPQLLSIEPLFGTNPQPYFSSSTIAGVVTGGSGLVDNPFSGQPYWGPPMSNLAGNLVPQAWFRSY